MLVIPTVLADKSPIIKGLIPKSLNFLRVVLKPTAVIEIINKSSAISFNIVTKFFQRS